MSCGCEPQKDPERWHRARGTKVCEAARGRRRLTEAHRGDAERRRRALAQHELAPEVWAEHTWVPGTGIYAPEVEAL